LALVWPHVFSFEPPRWYRPPELLFGSRYYSTAVDVWSVGCIFAELMLRTPYLAGESDMDQLKTIFRALGTPSEQDWPGHTKLPDYVPMGQFPKTPLRDLFTAASADTLNLLSQCLVYEPRKRISAKDVRYPPSASPRMLNANHLACRRSTTHTSLPSRIPLIHPNCPNARPSCPRRSLSKSSMGTR
jgi:cyclin-dependent kinase 7